VSGSDGTTDPSDGGSTDTGGWGGHHHGGGGWWGGSSWQAGNGGGGHNHGGGLDFSQWLNKASTSFASGDHSWWRGHNATSNTTADADSGQTDTPDTGSFVAHLSDWMSHHNDHHGWHS
jgi:hypothetical protein